MNHSEDMFGKEKLDSMSDNVKMVDMNNSEMVMYLHSGYRETVLFLTTTSPLSLALCCTTVFTLTILLEGTTCARQWVCSCFRGAYKNIEQ